MRRWLVWLGKLIGVFTTRVYLPFRFWSWGLDWIEVLIVLLSWWYRSYILGVCIVRSRIIGRLLVIQLPLNILLDNLHFLVWRMYLFIKAFVCILFHPPRVILLSLCGNHLCWQGTRSIYLMFLLLLYIIHLLPFYFRKSHTII